MSIDPASNPRHGAPDQRLDLSPEEIALARAARRFAAAAEAVERFDGPRQGPAHLARVEAWREQYRALIAAAGKVRDAE